MTLEELGEKRSALVAEMTAMDAKAKEEKRVFTEEERNSFSEKKAEIEKIDAEIEEEKRQMTLRGFSVELPKVQENEMENNINERADNFAQSGRFEMRAVLGSGNIVKPSKAANGINGLAAVANDIVDDVHAIALTGAGSWVAAYKDTDAVAKATTDGAQVGGTGSGASTGSSYNYVTINPAEWGVLDEISKQVKKLSPADYLGAVEESALIALRTFASNKIVTNVLASDLVKTKNSVALDAGYIRSLVLGYRSIAGKGNVKLYINQADLATLGEVRGTNEKKPVYEISFDAGTTTSGIIKDGGTAVEFRVLDCLETGTQLFGQPYTIDMPMWDGYSVETDEGGEYFKKNLIGIRGLQTANADLAAKHGMQKILQAAAA